jgi:eukaryotic-like serine/threonine-protein kinase
MSQRTYFVINPTFEIIKREEIPLLNISNDPNNPLFNQLMNEEQFLLGNKTRDNTLIINPTIKFFLESFEKPSTFASALTTFSQALEVTETEAFPLTQSFFEDMKAREIVVSLHTAKKILESTTVQVLKEGDIFKNFKIHTPLSISNFVHTYLAENTPNGEKVICKILHLPQKITKLGRIYHEKRFHQEFELMKEVGQYPHICPLLEWNKTENYAILGFIEGESLRRIFKQGDDISLSVRLFIFKQALESVAFLHQNRIIHGDIHVDNFIVQKDYNLFLIDFDLANRAKLKRGEVEWVGGMHEYIAPEKIDTNSFNMVKERADYGSEVFQLGVVLYYILYQKLPFKAPSWKELIEDILHQEPPYPSVLKALNEEIPKPFIEFLKKILHKSPQNRFQNAIEALSEWNHNIAVFHELT